MHMCTTALHALYMYTPHIHACKIWCHDDKAERLPLDYMYVSNIECYVGVSGPWHATRSPHRQCKPKIQTANRPENASVGREQLVYPHPPTRPRVPRHEAGQPGTSGVSMLWLEGNSIVDMCTQKRKDYEAPPYLSWPARHASCKYMLFTHIRVMPTLPWARKTTRAAVF